MAGSLETGAPRRSDGGAPGCDGADAGAAAEGRGVHLYVYSGAGRTVAIGTVAYPPVNNLDFPGVAVMALVVGMQLVRGRVPVPA